MRNIKYVLIATSILFMQVGAVEYISEDFNSSTLKKQELSNELKKEMNKNALYKIDNKTYNWDSLPSSYSKRRGKERLNFLDEYLKYKILLENLKNEKHQYKEQIARNLKISFDEIKRKGGFIDELNKVLSLKKIPVETIAKELIAEKDTNLTKEISDFYKENKESYNLPNTIDISIIVSQDKDEIEAIFTKLKKEKVTIKRFALFAHLYSKSSKLKRNNGYFGKISAKSSFDKEYFDKLWKSKITYGLFDKIMESNGYFSLVFILKKEKKRVIKFEEEKDNIRSYLLHVQEKRSAWTKKMIKKIMKKTTVTVYDNFKD